MAQSADESERNYVAQLLRHLEPRPGRLDFAIRLALICALTGLVTQIYQTPSAALTMYVAFYLNKSDRATSLVLNLIMVLLITIIIIIVFLAAKAVINDSMWRYVSIAAISLGMLFLTSASKLKPIGAIVAMIVGFALDELGTFPLGEGEITTRALLYAWGFVAIPAAVSMVVNLLLAKPPRRLAEQTISWRLRLAASMLRNPDARVRARFTEVLREGTAPIDGWLKLAGVEKSTSPADIAALRQAAASTLALSSAIDLMDRCPAAAIPSSLREHIAQMLDDMADILAAGGYPIEVSLEWPQAESQLTQPAAKVFDDIKEALVGFTNLPNQTTHAPKSVEKESGFLAKDAFTNPDHVRYALKTTVAAMFCYTLYSLLDWPGIHTCFITCYLVSLDSTAETVEKLALRILGCLIGAAAGYGAILYLLPDITSIGGLMTVTFLGGLGAAYVAAGSPRISYAGFQIAFAFFLCVVQGPAPAFDLTIARDRVIGILIGNIVTFLVLTQLWPVSVVWRIDPAIAALLRGLGTMARTLDGAARRALASEAQNALGAVEADLHLSRYEPAGVRPPKSWLSSREIVAREIAALESALFLADDQDTADRLESLAGMVGSPDVARPHVAAGARTRSQPIARLIDAHLQSLERALMNTHRDEREVKHYAPA